MWLVATVNPVLETENVETFINYENAYECYKNYIHSYKNRNCYIAEVSEWCEKVEVE